MIKDGLSMSEVAAQARAHANAACRHATQFQLPLTYSTTSLRASMFDAVRSAKGFRRLEHLISRLTASRSAAAAFNDYVRARWFALFAAVAAAAVLLLMLVAILLSFKTPRAFLSKCRRRRVVEESSESLSLPAPGRLRILNERLFLSLAGALLVSLAAFSVVFGFGVESALDLHDSAAIANCNMWLEFDGYFNGAEGLKPPAAYVDHYADISTGATGEQLLARITDNWIGATELHAKLAELADMTAPTTQNALYQNLTTESHRLRTRVERAQSVLDDELAAVDLVTKVYAKAVPEAAAAVKDIAQVGGWNGGYDLQFALDAVYQSKATIFKSEMIAALKHAWLIIANLIDKYAGPNSPLMNKASTTVQRTSETIEQIDAAMKVLYQAWRDHSHLLAATEWFFIVFFICEAAAGAAAIVLTACLAVHVWQHTRKLRRQRAALTVCTKGSQRIWKAAWVACLAAGGLSALTSGLAYLGASVGADGCDVVNTSLLDEGRWALFGPRVLEPPSGEAAAHVDMETVFDVCLGRQGLGTIGVSLGLDSSISEINDDVTDAITDMSQTRDLLLLENSRHMRVHVIGYIMNELLRGFTHKTHYKKLWLWRSEPVYGFNGLQELSFENGTTAIDGGRTMLSPVAAWPNLMGTIGVHGLFYTLGTIPDAYQVLNEISDLAFAQDPKTTMPRFCGALARQRKLACSHFKADGRKIIDLADPALTQADIDGWVGKSGSDYALDTAVPTYGEYRSKIGQRTRQLIGALMYMERVSQLQGLKSFPEGVLECVDATTSKPRDCTFEEYRQFYIADLSKHWAKISSAFDVVVADVNAYVDGLAIPKSRNIVDKANSLIFQTNCQFQGTALDYAVRAPLCTAYFPALLELGLISFNVFLISLLLAFQLQVYRPWCCDSGATYSIRDQMESLEVGVLAREEIGEHRQSATDSGEAVEVRERAFKPRIFSTFVAVSEGSFV